MPLVELPAVEPMTKSERCNHCGQKIQLAYKPVLNKHVLTMLKTAAQQVIDTKVNEFKRSEVCESRSDYVNFSRLRFFGLAAHVKHNGKLVRGTWLITRNGWAFLRGELELHKWVKIKDNHIVERSPETIGVRDVFRGSDVIQTTFEYFDDNGNPVGIRPNIARSSHWSDRQATLI